MTKFKNRSKNKSVKKLSNSKEICRKKLIAESQKLYWNTLGQTETI